MDIFNGEQEMKLSIWVPSILLRKNGRGISKDGKYESNNPPFRCSFGPKTRICMHHGYSSWWKIWLSKLVVSLMLVTPCNIIVSTGSINLALKNELVIPEYSGAFRWRILQCFTGLSNFSLQQTHQPLKRTMQAQRASMELAFWPRTPSRPWERALFPWGGVKVANKTINFWKHKTEICNSVSVSWNMHAKSSWGQ